MKKQKFLLYTAWIALIAMINSCSLYRIKAVERIEAVQNELGITPENTVFYVHYQGNVHELTDINRLDGHISGNLITPEADEIAIYDEAIRNGRVSKEFIEKNKHESPMRTGSLSKLNESIAQLKAVVQHNNSLHLKNQIHCYVDEAKMEQNGAFSFDVEKVIKCEILKKSAEMNGVLKGFLIFLIVIGILILLIIIVFLITCNCPRLYINNGNTWVYSNSLFNGALNPNLERNDYRSVPDYQASNSNFTMEIRNEESEIQHINQVNLKVVSHPSDVSVISDQFGNFYSIKQPISASSVFDSEGNSLQTIFKDADNKAHDFNTLRAAAHQSVQAKFTKVQATKDAKIVLRLKNSDWAGMVHYSFKQALGSAYKGWSAKNQQKSNDELLAAFEETGVALTLSVKVGKKWKKVETLPMMGNVAFQDVVVNVDRSLIKGSDLEIKLSTGFNMWSIDQIALDQSDAVKMDVTTFAPTSVFKSGLDYKQAIEQDDQAYLVQEKGETSTFSFKGLPVHQGLERSIFVHGKGFYLQTDNPSNKPDWSAIKTLRSNFGMAKFSYELYLNQYSLGRYGR